ncbi:thioesterase [Mycolicibacterium agri]|uniref:Acyl-coenzyme A thioesterase THEM4 n=1 Tax=Mycolicibacterium agri TaxID=36811 RepID=A0A2A7MXH1_MYCAG|nr:PaaI family thioesterase [Mycolicibacterium agri]PEG36239.1 thioesterase [Mycolicibacterium agri]GFG48761.1 thioesterase [Mycolicibacterium agri]
MLEFTHIGDVTSDELDRMRAVYEPLAESVRALVDATIRTEVDADEVAAVKAEIDAATARLRAKQIDGAFGVRYTSDGESMAWGNPVVGVGNPIAPPVVIRRDDAGRVYTDFEMGAPYEGPPGHVHGGISALVLDHVLGEAATDGTMPRFTGTITMRYLRPTRLGRLHAEAQTDRVEGVKTFVVGHLADDEGITVEAEGVFITPKWARGEGE